MLVVETVIDAPGTRETGCDVAIQAGASGNPGLHADYDEEFGTSVDPVPLDLAPLPHEDQGTSSGNIASNFADDDPVPINLVPVPHEEQGTSSGNIASNFANDDETVEWEEEINLQDHAEYILKPKVNQEFKPKIVTQSESVSFEEIRKTNPDVSPRWLASTLAKKQLQPRSDEMQRILRAVDHMWFDDSKKDRTHVAQFLAKVYTDSVNPFVLVGFLIDNVRDSHTAKTTTLAFFLLKEFDKWYKFNKRKVYPEKYLSVDLQMHVFDICTRNHLTMLDMAVRCFHLQYPGNDQFLLTVKNFLSKKKYKEVCSFGDLDEQIF